MISTQQVVQFHCLQIIRIYKQTINRSHGFHGRSPIFFLQWRLTSADIIVFCHPIIQLNIVCRAGFVLSGHSCNMNRKRCEIQYFSNPFHTATFTILYKFLKKKGSRRIFENVAKMFIKIQMDFEARFTFYICHQHWILRTSWELLFFFFFLDLKIYIHRVLS